MMGMILLVVLILLLWAHCPPGPTAGVGDPPNGLGLVLLILLVLLLMGRLH